MDKSTEITIQQYKIQTAVTCEVCERNQHKMGDFSQLGVYEHICNPDTYYMPHAKFLIISDSLYDNRALYMCHLDYVKTQQQLTRM